MLAKLALLCLAAGVQAGHRFRGPSLSGRSGFGPRRFTTPGGPRLDYPDAVYPAQPYDFGYDTVDEYGTRLFHMERGNANNGKSGSYGYTDANGLYRRVDYVADAYGYRASVQTNEPGTQSGATGDAVFHVGPPAVGANARSLAAFMATGRAHDVASAPGFGLRRRRRRTRGSRAGARAAARRSRFAGKARRSAAPARPR